MNIQNKKLSSSCILLSNFFLLKKFHGLFQVCHKPATETIVQIYFMKFEQRLDKILLEDRIDEGLLSAIGKVVSFAARGVTKAYKYLQKISGPEDIFQSLDHGMMSHDVCSAQLRMFGMKSQLFLKEY